MQYWFQTNIQYWFNKRGPNGPDIALTWVVCHNLVKIHLVVIDTLSFLCSVLLLVKADGNHLAVPNWKKRHNAKIIVIQSWYNSIERFFPVLYFAIFCKGCHIDRYCLILKQLFARTILTQIWSKSIKRLLRYCHFHVLCYFSNGKWRPS